MLIREGAVPVLCGEDIAGEYQWLFKGRAQGKIKGEKVPLDGKMAVRLVKKQVKDGDYKLKSDKKVIDNKNKADYDLERPELSGDELAIAQAIEMCIRDRGYVGLSAAVWSHHACDRLFKRQPRLIGEGFKALYLKCAQLQFLHRPLSNKSIYYNTYHCCFSMDIILNSPRRSPSVSTNLTSVSPNFSSSFFMFSRFCPTAVDTSPLLTPITAHLPRVSPDRHAEILSSIIFERTIWPNAG